MAADKKKKVTSTDIKLALRDMHLSRSSYFITECKTCSTYFPDPQGLLKFEYNSLEEFLKRWKVEAVYHGCK